MRHGDFPRAWRAAPLLLVLALPFGEGGATPRALFLVHSLVVLGGLAVAFLPAPPPRRDLLPREISVAIPAFLAVTLLAAWGSPYPYASFLRCWDLAVALAVFLMVRRAGWEEGDRRLLFDCVLASASVQALIVIGGSLSGGAALSVARWGLLNSNHEAAYLALGVLLAAPGWLRGGGRRRWVRGAGILLCLSAFALLASRGALLGLSAGVLLLARMEWSNLGTRLRLAGGMALAAVVAGTLATLFHRFTAAGDPFPFERSGIWAADLRCFSGNPFLGVGPGIFRHVAHRFNFPLEGPVHFARSFTTPHSDYLGLLAETGIAGFAAGAFLLISILVMLARHARGSTRSGSALLSAFVALAVQAAVEDLSTRPAILITVAILLAAAGPEDPARRDLPSPSSLRRGLFFAVPLAVLWAACVLNPYVAFRSDRAMRRAASLAEMEARFETATRANPFQARTWGFPAAAFLAAEPPVDLTLDLYARFRRELDRGIEADSTSADLLISRGRLEARAFRALFRDAAAAGRALESYRDGVMRVPHDPRPRFELAGFLLELGRRPEATDHLRMALAEEPGFLRARLALSRVLLEEGDPEGARREWREVASSRKKLITYRPDSGYSAEIVRDDPSLERFLQERLGPS